MGLPAWCSLLVLCGVGTSCVLPHCWSFHCPPGIRISSLSLSTVSQWELPLGSSPFPISNFPWLCILPVHLPLSAPSVAPPSAQVDFNTLRVEASLLPTEVICLSKLVSLAQIGPLCPIWLGRVSSNASQSQLLFSHLAAWKPTLTCASRLRIFSPLQYVQCVLRDLQTRYSGNLGPFTWLPTYQSEQNSSGSLQFCGTGIPCDRRGFHKFLNLPTRQKLGRTSSIFKLMPRFRTLWLKGRYAADCTQL